MSLDYQQVQAQVTIMGENARQRESRLNELREQARELLAYLAPELDLLEAKVQAALRHDPGLRCARPTTEPIDGHYPLPALPQRATLLAVDGSQIAPDRHAPVSYAMINLGGIQMQLGSAEPPRTHIQCTLLYDEELFTAAGTLSEDVLALKRDLNERRMLVELCKQIPPPVITFTDGPLELWGAKDGGGEAGSEYQRSLEKYLTALGQLHEMNAANAGYVDKPGANLLVRLLEVAAASDEELQHIKRSFPLRGVREIDLLGMRLEPGERSAVFAIQSQSAKEYTGPLALHFFYLNVGREGKPWLARVEIPAWVAGDQAHLDGIHAVLVHQAHMLGGRAYPYLLHRAHETAVVKQEDKEQVTQMIIMELRRRGVEVGEGSHKQGNKDLAGRKRMGT